MQASFQRTWRFWSLILNLYLAMLVFGTLKTVLMIVWETAFVGGNHSLFIPWGLALLFQDQWNNSDCCMWNALHSKGKILDEMFFWFCLTVVSFKGSSSPCSRSTWLRGTGTCFGTRSSYRRAVTDSREKKCESLQVRTSLDTMPR